jgi:ubiquinone/menaquinone biosynthesis C-methylase UbiE
LSNPAASPRVLILGVTPALIGAPWPAEAEVHAVDYDQVMIDTHWTPREGAHCYCLRWEELPFPVAHFDLVVGDCSFNALPGLDHYDHVLKEITRVMKPSARLVARFFMQSDPRLTLGYVANHVEDRFASYSAAAMRLLIPLAASADDGALHSLRIEERIREEWGDVDEFLSALRQSGDDMERAKRTFAFDQRLNYPDRHDIVRIFGAYFGEISFAFPDYECGEFCPTVSFASASAR